MNNKIGSYFFITVLLTTFFGITLSVTRHNSAVYDEAFYVAFGNSILRTGDYRMAIDKPVGTGIILALPSMFMKDAKIDTAGMDWKYCDGWQNAKDPSEWFQYRWNLALGFVYKNTVSADKILNSARVMMILCSVLFGLLIFLLTSKLFSNTIAGMGTLIWYVFNTEIIAYSGYAVEDMMVTGWYTIAVLLFIRFLRAPGIITGILVGLTAVMAILTKLTGLLLLPTFIILAGIDFINVRKQWKFFAVPVITGIIAGIVLVLLMYRFTEVNYFVLAIKNMLATQGKGQACYLLGKYSQDGFRYYYLAVLAMKLSIPLVLAAGYGVYRMLKSNKVIALQLISAVFILLLFASVSTKQLGVRYVLPVYPVLFIFAGYACACILQEKSGKYAVIKKGGMAVLLLLYLVANAYVYPHYLSYFNILAGGKSNGWKYVVESNCDWGQDLHNLRDYLKKNGYSDVILSYYGACTPEYAGFEFQDLFSFSVWGEKNYVNSDNPVKEALAVSVTNLQGQYFGQLGYNIFDWLKHKPAVAFIGNSIMVYDITNDKDTCERLAKLYYTVNNQAGTERMIRRIELLK
ncbi:MAG: hypothetical protein WC955_06140 [Elusimicrobiota bacterium]